MLSLHNRYRKKHQASSLSNQNLLNLLAQQSAERQSGSEAQQLNVGSCQFELYTPFPSFIFDSKCDGNLININLN